MKTALISVYNKKGIVEFAKELVALGFKILASGGTAKELISAGIKVTDVASLVGGGAILGHRVVTLSREIHAGLLARDVKEDRDELERLNIPWIDLVCVDLYPLEEAIAEALSQKKELPPTPSLEKRGREAVLEKTDIGGPTMLRSAAKGRRIVVCDMNDRMAVIIWLKNGEPDREKFLDHLAAKAEFIVANYCLNSARYHGQGKYEGMLGQQVAVCKYGENGYQTPAGLFSTDVIAPSRVAARDKFMGLDKSGNYNTDALSLINFKLVAGTAPSYNNWADVDRLLQTITHIAAGFDYNPSPSFAKASAGKLALPFRKGEGTGSVPFIAVGVKHGNPCGAAVSDEPSSAIQKMLEGDLRAIFGGLVMVNFPIDEKLAEILLTHEMFPTTPSSAKASEGKPSPFGRHPSLKKEGNIARRLLDGIIAPEFSPAAIEMLKRKGDKCRFLVNPALENLSKASLDGHRRFRYVRGGFLKQPNYLFVLNFSAPEIAISGKITEKQRVDLLLAWAIGSTSNSNTVTIVKDAQLLGNGVGQQDRVGCCQLAIKRALDAGHNINGAAVYSDSFFPFVDGVQTLVDAGISAIFATSGSVKDNEVKEFCAKNNINLVMLPDSMARGFFGH